MSPLIATPTPEDATEHSVRNRTASGEVDACAAVAVGADRRKRAAPRLSATWNYLLVTAANEVQAKAYEEQIALRRRRGSLQSIEHVMVAPDPLGVRIGSGGSTVLCLMKVLQRELLGNWRALSDPAAWFDALRRLRIFILHGGGDSRRLPPYAPGGKLFVPLPDGGGGAALFDRQVAAYLRLPKAPQGAGQIVIAAGDVLVEFDPAEVTLAAKGITGLGCPATPEQAARHGVYWATADGEVELFLQKPTVAEQRAKGLGDASGRSILDVGVMSFDSATAVTLLEMCATNAAAQQGSAWTGPLAEPIAAHGLDFYREIACALGRRATAESHAAGARQAGSQWDDSSLAHVFQAIGKTPFHVCVPPSCVFLHWGTARQLLESGRQWSPSHRGGGIGGVWIGANNEFALAGEVRGGGAWIEGCRIQSPLVVQGDNLVVGVDVDRDLTLPSGACLDVMPGWSRDHQKVFFVRCYGVDDDLHGRHGPAGIFCGQPLDEWLATVGADADEIWASTIGESSRSVWNASVIPAEGDPRNYRRWLWMFDPTRATVAEKRAWRAADRYSFADMASLANRRAFHRRRARLRANSVGRTALQCFGRNSDLSAVELSQLISHADDRSRSVADFLQETHRAWQTDAGAGLDAIIFPRMMHSLASAALRFAGREETLFADIFPRFDEALPAAEATWLKSLDLLPEADVTVAAWSARARAVAFQHLGQTIMVSGDKPDEPPVSVLRSDELVWGRAPVRLDLCGGWTDTPPYALEFGGCVLNAAVNLNGQPSIQAFARLTREPVISLTSIDRGTRCRIESMEELVGDRVVESEFALVKTALVSSLFGSNAARDGMSLRAMLESVGGGIDIATLAAVPKGSGLGTSSIMGALVLAVLDRFLGRPHESTRLFHRVLKLEQAMTTGGGWQDQVGGVIGGVKLISTRPGLVPEPNIRPLPGDVLAPVEQGGQTLLYYTGITRLAKNIVQRVVARYLDRDPAAVAALAELRQLAVQGADAMTRRDLAQFGQCVDAAWRLNQRLDPDCSNEAIDSLLARARPYLYGAKLLGAGGGGFLLLVCRSPGHAVELRAALDAAPPNGCARFFPFEVNQEGLRVTVC